MFGDTVYLDNAAATRLDERVLEAMKPYLFDTYAVATSEFGYSMGIEAREALDRARASLAGRLGGAAEEFVFTSGSTESSNMALKGVALALGREEGPPPRHLACGRLPGAQHRGRARQTGLPHLLAGCGWRRVPRSRRC